MTFSIVKPLYGPIRAINNSQFTMTLAIFFVLIAMGLILPFAVVGQTFYDTFENYPIGNLDGQDNWFQYPGSATHFGKVQNDYVFQGLKAGECFSGGEPFYSVWKSASTTPTGTISLKFLILDPTSSVGATILGLRADDGVGTSTGFAIKIEWNNDNKIYNAFAIDDYGIDWNLFYNDVATGTWQTLYFQWDSGISKMKAGIGNVSSNWVFTESVFTDINSLYFSDCGFVHFYFDNITEQSNCSIYSDLYNCQGNACCWFTYGNASTSPYCGNCQQTDCGVGQAGFQCQPCGDQESCESVSGCYWFPMINYPPNEGRCKFGTRTCDVYDKQFCENQSECEAVAGYWYSDYCWYVPRPNYFVNWDTYYAENGAYESSSAFTNNLASSTLGFLDNIGGLLFTFSQNFDLAEAKQQGSDLGSFVPMGIGYLSVFNELFGGYPIAQYFLFFIIFMVAIAVIKIVLKIFPALKFW
ncbi:MAG: hypothetical protein IMZ52_10645 [Actinobacteria bacterium]|nr:hypothetical protein [Actinomycetota bacterium]